MALQRSRERLKIRGGYFYILDQSAALAIYKTVGHTQETALTWEHAVEDVHDEGGEYLGPLAGNEMITAKPVGLQATKDEIEIIRGLKGKDLKILYLVPITVVGVKKIQQYKFDLGFIVPKVELTFNTGKRTLPFELRISATAQDVWAAELSGSATIDFERADLVYLGITGDTTLTNIVPSGYKITRIRGVASGMITNDKVRIGTTAGGQEVVADVAINANGIFDFTIVGGETTGPTLYVADDGSTTTPWAGSQNLDLYFTLAAV